MVDGLDEIDRSEREKFFHLILPLVESRVDSDTRYRIKIFISSRGEDDIKKSLDFVGRIRRKSYEITGDDNHRDIAFYVSLRAQELQKKFGLSDLRRKEISKDVRSRAGGVYECGHISSYQSQLLTLGSLLGVVLVMFLLAKLILDNLMNQTNLEELEEEMRPEMLPSELKDP